MNRLAWLPALMVAVNVAMAQSPPPVTAPESTLVPTIRINALAASIQQGIFPDYYRTHSVADDVTWTTANSRDVGSFVSQSAESLLRLLTTLSGIRWQEKELELYLLRYFSAAGSSDPLLIPIGGIRQGGLVEAMPTGASLKLDLIYFLADRMLLQNSLAATPDTTIANHPLMQYQPYRRELLALLLALEASRQLLGRDSTQVAYESPFWIRHVNGRRLIEEYLLAKWSLSAEKPLVRWLTESPIDSEFINLTGQIAAIGDESRRPGRQYIEGIPLKGRFGFSVKLNGAGNLVVEKIDDSRLAWLCGVRANDVIKQVNGKHPRSQRELMELILASFDLSAVVLQITREGKPQSVLLRPVRQVIGADSSAVRHDSL